MAFLELDGVPTRIGSRNLFKVVCALERLFIPGNNIYPSPGAGAFILSFGYVHFYEISISSFIFKTNLFRMGLVTWVCHPNSQESKGRRLTS